MTKKIVFDDYEKEIIKKERLVLEVNGQKELDVGTKLKNKLKMERTIKKN